MQSCFADKELFKIFGKFNSAAGLGNHSWLHSQGSVPGVFWLVCLLGRMPSGRGLTCPWCHCAWGTLGDGSSKAAILDLPSGQWIAVCPLRTENSVVHPIRSCSIARNTKTELMVAQCPCICSRLPTGDEALMGWNAASLSEEFICWLWVFQPQNSLATEQIGSLQVLVGASLWIWLHFAPRPQQRLPGFLPCPCPGHCPLPPCPSQCNNVLVFYCFPLRFWTLREFIQS